MDATPDMARMPRERVTGEAVSPALFAHFVLRTSNFAAMRAWYKTVLNARIVYDNGTLCFMTYDDEHHRVALANVAGLQQPAADSWGLSHVAYSYRTMRDLLSTYVRLRDQGIVPFRPINHGPTVSLYYHDPDGNAVELQVDAFATKEAAAAYFDSNAFRENPIGVRFDPEDLVQAFEAGASEEELMRRPAGTAEAAMTARR